MSSPDVVIVGSGILGLAHARAAALAGLSVEVIEQTTTPVGASIRNFGMIWPIGQPAGELKNLALRSREIWLEVAETIGLFADPCGSLQLAEHEVEGKILKEFHELNPDQTELLAPEEAVARFPILNPEFLHSALFSRTELCVNPREALRKLPAAIAKEHGVRFSFDEAVIGIQDKVVTTTRRTVEASHIFVCPGANFKVLFPDFFKRHGVQQCMLQMLQLAPSDPETRLETMIAGGLTLGHYSGFRDCPSFAELKQFHEESYAEFVKRGIHVMASQHAESEVTVGDSHLYGQDLLPFSEESTDEMILGYLRKMILCEDWNVSSRWQGTYAKHPSMPLLTERVGPATTVVSSPGGAGMTLSFGFAERNIFEFLLNG